MGLMEAGSLAAGRRTPCRIYYRVYELAKRPRRPETKDLFSQGDIGYRVARLTGLPKASVANVSQIVTLDKTFLTERAGKLPRAKLDLVLSGIPFSTMPRDVAVSILRAVHAALAPEGRFVAYQVRDRVELLGREVFGPARVETELLNLPPMRVFGFGKSHPI